MSSKKEITIIIPDGLTINQSIEQKNIELFISNLFSSLSGKEYVQIKYEARLNIFSCNDKEIKEFLTMIVRLKMLDGFKSQFKKLLFDKKTLKLVNQDKFYAIDIQENGTYPDFTWIITIPA